MDFEKMNAMISEIADFFAIVIAYIEELLAKFETKFGFENGLEFTDIKK